MTGINGMINPFFKPSRSGSFDFNRLKSWNESNFVSLPAPNHSLMQRQNCIGGKTTQKFVISVRTLAIAPFRYLLQESSVVLNGLLTRDRKVRQSEGEGGKERQRSRKERKPWKSRDPGRLSEGIPRSIRYIWSHMFLLLLLRSSSLSYLA